MSNVSTTADEIAKVEDWLERKRGEQIELEKYCGHPQMLATWFCRDCHHWHCWSGAPTSSSGHMLARSNVIPFRVRRMIVKTRVEAME